MSMFKEVQETDKPIETEKQRLSTAFENNKKNEGGETRHLKTINEQYEGQKYPGTDVEYKHERIQVNGEKVEGVFPQFESKDVGIFGCTAVFVLYADAGTKIGT